VAAEEFTAAYLVSHRRMLLDRATTGLVRDGHGDLRAEHVVLEDPIAIVDCLEFDPALRQIDVAEDLAFLTMDLTRLGASPLASTLVAAYRDAGGEPGEPGLLAFHAAQRAWVRAKVELLSGREDGARAYLRLGRRYSWQARGPLVLVVCGTSGSGKSHLAAALAQVSGSALLRSDLVRKELAGIGPAATARGEHYSAGFSRRTYLRLGELAAAELERSGLERSGLVIVDATFRRRSERAQFAAGAGALPARVAFVQCLAPREVRLGRIRRRRAGARDASDVTVELARRQRFAPLTEVEAHHHLPLRTDRDTEDVVHAVETWLNEIRISPRTGSGPERMPLESNPRNFET
jgi:predicted kinase